MLIHRAFFLVNRPFTSKLVEEREEKIANVRDGSYFFSISLHTYDSDFTNSKLKVKSKRNQTNTHIMLN